ncbi:MAG: hypothetical protein H0T42_15090 [Deltaproteobacteria bacterium]|nr:hypothetical protein [Deltaproteobacteria bacterium]
MRISGIAIVVLVSGVLAGVAGAQPVSDKAAAQAAFAEGQQSYAAGEYLAAAVRFESAYASEPDPVYLFNIAQAYRLGNACAKAVSYYKRFLADVPNPPNLAKVEQYLQQAEACAGTSTLLPAQTPLAEPPVLEPPVNERPPADDPGRTKRWLGIGGMVLGGAALGVAVYYSAEGSRLTEEHNRRRAMCPCDAGYADDLRADGRRADLLAYVGYPVGGVLVIGGVVLYLLGRSSESSSIAVVPTSDGAYAVGAFTF